MVKLQFCSSLFCGNDFIFTCKLISGHYVVKMKYIFMFSPNMILSYSPYVCHIPLGIGHTTV